MAKVLGSPSQSASRASSGTVMAGTVASASSVQLPDAGRSARAIVSEVGGRPDQRPAVSMANWTPSASPSNDLAPSRSYEACLMKSGSTTDMSSARAGSTSPGAAVSGYVTDGVTTTGRTPRSRPPDSTWQS
ncbi:hypothetical protein H9L21_14350 [Aeromicrobium senzhongii]|uniref:Uncharacterized protein n=1 Tax=Aeromicrobium senzhongii TaxID=2663859 RepID=A0ABX6SUX2_9ACTN|nr:hypothetical protein [Aeromicrobium senzhongii]QNL94239.1 hypothetical protein H9L21_14350 [Aeromicrobium senzhongii]